MSLFPIGWRSAVCCACRAKISSLQSKQPQKSWNSKAMRVNKEVLSDSPVVITHLPFKSEKSEPFNGPNVKLNNILTNFITVISDCLLLLWKTMKITNPIRLTIELEFVCGWNRKSKHVNAFSSSYELLKKTRVSQDVYFRVHIPAELTVIKPND